MNFNYHLRLVQKLYKKDVFKFAYNQAISASYITCVRMKPATVKTSATDMITQSYRLLCVQSDSKENIRELVGKNKVVIFMKGIPDAPKCGFSNAVVQILRMHGVKYDSYDVLEDENLRQGIKEYSNWPTIPQVFINGDFIGGCDLLLQMHQNGDLIEELQKVGIQSALLNKEQKK